MPKISCVGIIGDGCGADREFIVEDEKLFAYDPYTKITTPLLDNVYKAKSISKHRCILSIECEDEEIQFDLSELKKV